MSAQDPDPVRDALYNEDVSLEDLRNLYDLAPKSEDTEALNRAVSEAIHHRFPE